MIVFKSKRPDWPAHKCYVFLGDEVTTAMAIKWRAVSKVKCLIFNERVYFTSQKDAMFFTMRWE